jgi:Uma2 family endonuclease
MANPSRRIPHHFTYADYLAYERDSGRKHEYIDGVIVAMAGGSPRHNALAARVIVAIGSALHTGCLVFQSDQKVRVPVTGVATYPDTTVVCGPIQCDPADAMAITNPTLIVEVLSPSTEEYDRGEKWHDYQTIPSLREYVLVSQVDKRIERYVRLPSGDWEYRDNTSGQLALTTGGTLDLDTLYANLPL